MNMTKALAVCLLSLTASAQDGTVTTGIYQYNKASSWPENAVPGGVGATITVTAPGGNGKSQTVGPSTTFYSTSAVIGRLVWPKSDAAGDLNAYDAVCAWLGCYSENSVKDNVAPTDTRMSNNKLRWTVNTNTITMDNGGAGAEISIDAYNDNVGGYVSNTRYFITPQLVLNDDLTLRHVGKKGGSLGDGTWPNGDWLCMMLTGGITDNGADKSLTVDLTPAHTIAGGVNTAINAVYLGGEGDFSGDVTITHGVVRTGGARGHDGVGNQLGHDNTITATSGFSGVDLYGCTFDRNNTIRIGGIPQQGYGGVLSSSYLNPLVEAVWKSPVEIVSETAVGGNLDPSTYSVGAGDLRISGPISDGGNNAKLHVRSYGNVTLDGDNAFGGDISLDGGFLTLGKAASAGTGKVIFNGGTYRVTKSTDYDVMSGPHEVAAGKRLAFKVEKGVTYTPAANDGGYGFFKSGRGTLVLAHANPNASSGQPDEIEEGEVILDYTADGASAKLIGTKTLRPANDARIVWRSAENAAGTGHPWLQTQFPASGAFVTFRNEGWAFVNAVDGCKDGVGVFNIEDLHGQGFKLGYKSSLFLSPLFVWNKSSYAYQDGTYSRPAPDEAYALAWGAGNVVDVKASEPATTTTDADATARRLRFNTPNGGNEVLVTLTGTTALSDGAILVTEAMGSTPVRITGGVLSYSGTSAIRIMNFNTNATLTIESDIRADAASLFVCGPGRTVVKGDIAVSGSIAVSEGVLAVDTADQFVGLRTPGATKNYFKNIYLTNGGRLGSNGTSFTLGAKTDPDGYLATPYVYISKTGGGFDARGEDVISLASATRLNLVKGGAFIKDGTGTVKTIGQGLKLEGAGSISLVSGCGDERVNFLDVRSGVLDTSAATTLSAVNAYGSTSPTVAFAHKGATLKSACALSTLAAGGNVGALAMAGRWQMVSEDATVDLGGVTATMGGTTWGAMSQTYGKAGPRGDGPFSGSGDVTIDNTGAAASINAQSVNIPDFTGTLTAKAPFNTTGGLEMPKGKLVLSGEETHQFKMVYAPWQTLRLGALSGTAALTVEGLDRSATDAQVVLGRACDETVAYDGLLTFRSCNNDTWKPLPRIVKTGSNTIVLGNAANDIKSATTIEDGTLVAGAATALGTGAVYLGGAGVQAGATPCFRTGAGVTQFANDIQVLADTPADVTCSIGGNAELTGAVTLKAPTVLTAAEGETLRVSGTLSIQSAFGKSGAGSVELANDVTVGDFTYDGGTTTVDGTLTIQPGATLTVTRDALKEKGGHVLFEADAISGAFATVVGLKPGWRLKSANGRIWLDPPGLILLLK